MQVLLDWGNNEQKNKFLKPLAKGEKLGAYSLSEPQSGSDARNMKTFAKKTEINILSMVLKIGLLVVIAVI